MNNMCNVQGIKNDVTKGLKVVPIIFCHSTESIASIVAYASIPVHC